MTNFDGFPKPDEEWFGGREGNCGYWGDDEWRATQPPRWTYTRNLFPHIWFSLEIWAATERGRCSGIVRIHFGHHVKHDLERTRRKLRSAAAVRRWANAIVEREARDWRPLLAVFAPSLYRPADTEHVYRLERDGTLAPFATVFRRVAGDAWQAARSTVDYYGNRGWGAWPYGTYLILDPSGRTRMMDLEPGVMSGSGAPPALAARVGRWTRHYPPTPEVPV